jgi:hypothetical protein
MATLTKGKTFTQPSSNNTATDLNNLVDLATIQNVGALVNEISPVAIQSGASLLGGTTGTAGTTVPALRKLGTTANDAAPGTVADSNGLTTAKALKFGSNTAINLSTTNPTAGQLLSYDGTNIVGLNSAATAWSAGGASADSANSGSDTTLHTDTAGEFTKLQVGYLIRLPSVSATAAGFVSSITGDDLVLSGINMGTNNNVAWEYQIGSQKRPWNDKTAKSALFTVANTDTGQLFECSTSGGSYVATLPSAAGFRKGDSVSFAKTSDDANSVTVTCVGGDTFSGVTSATTIALSTRGATLTLVSDGAGIWRVVAKRGLRGDALQTSARISTATVGSSITTPHFNPNTGTAPTSAMGEEILTTGAVLKMKPQSGFSILHVRGMICGGLTGGAYVTLALFSGATLLAVNAVGYDGNAKDMFQQRIDFHVASPAANTEITFVLRAAVNSNAFRVNGFNGNNTLIAGGAVSWLEVVEEAA